MRVTFHIPDEAVTRLLHAHGGRYSQWLHELRGDWKGKRGFYVRFDREEDPEGAGTGVARVGRRKVMRGLALMATGAPGLFGQWLEENDDDVCFDVALQYILFGKEIYG